MMRPGAHQRNCASTGLLDEDLIHHLVDHITESTPCKLVVPTLGVQTMVATRLAEQYIEETLFNGCLIPQGYTRVHLDSIICAYNRSKLDYPRETAERRLSSNVGHYIQWRKRDIVFGKGTDDSGSTSAPEDTDAYPVLASVNTSIILEVEVISEINFTIAVSAN